LRSVDHLALDALDLDIRSVTLEGVADAGLEFEIGDGQLEIALPQPAPAGVPITLNIEYSARPRAGMYFQPDPRHPEHTFVTTYGEGGLHANWMPIYTGVNDKFTSEMVVTVPRPYVVISNGSLVETIDSGDSRRTFHWSQERPHSAYLIALYVGDFERGTLPPAFGEIPVAYWVPRGRLAEGAYAFRNTPRMVEFFSRRFDYRYPWVKYDQIAMPNYPIGAMEHTGVTGINDSILRHEGEAPLDFGGPTFDEVVTDWSAEAIISHELAHHWFGDTLTCNDLSVIWLNESFATYLMMLWNEESLGGEQLAFDLDQARRHYFDYVATEHIIRPLEYHYFDSANDIYNEQHTYLKGAAVLHSLRRILGDEAFFGAMAHYLDRFEFDNVDSHDLEKAILEVTGQRLDWFFADWVTGGGHPQFEVRWRYLEDRRQVDLEILQVQPIVEGQGLFRLPVRITLATAEKTWRETVWVEEEETHVLLPADEKPLMVSFDGDGDLVAEIDFEKTVEELSYQAMHDGVAGRLRALRQLAARYPTRPETLATLSTILQAPATAPDGSGFWALQAEAAERLGEVRTVAAEEMAAQALAATDYRVRKAAVLALPRFGTESAASLLLKAVREDPHDDVVGAAIVALARIDPDLDAEILVEQLGRESWYDEIRIAVMQAFAELARPELLPHVRPWAEGLYNEDLRQAALAVWVESAPTDERLHELLIELADSPFYNLQQYAMETLGKLYVQDAESLLEEYVAGDYDASLTQLAKEALEEIGRVTD